MPSTMNVIASSRNTSAIAPVVRSEATNMYAVKIPHVHRYSPSAADELGLGDDPAARPRSNEIQNAP